MAWRMKPSDPKNVATAVALINLVHVVMVPSNLKNAVTAVTELDSTQIG